MKSYTQLRGLSSCELMQKLSQHPVFAAVAVNPYYYQLYSISASQPLRYTYVRYTIAGVFVGYKWENDYPYWILSVRRHQGESNRVHLRLTLANLFGRMGGKMFELEGDVEDYKKNRFGQMKCRVCTVEELVHMSLNCTHLTVLDHCLNDVVIGFNLNAYHLLQSVEVKQYSLRQSPALILNGLTHLVRVQIGADSFTELTGAEVPNTVFSKGKKVVLKNLPVLQSFSVDDRAFSDFVQFTASGRSDGWR